MGNPTFGTIRTVGGKAVSTGSASRIPLSLLNNLARSTPIPITINGTSQRVFTVAATDAKPVALWNGDDYIELKSSLAYTWTDDSENSILNATTGVAADGAAAAGVYYMYVGLTSAGVATIKPSTAAPSNAGNKAAGILSHPGTGCTQFWNYVGFMICTSATVFTAAVKTGFTYEFPEIAVATTSAWALLDYSASLPKHGVEAGGFLQTGGVSQTISVGTDDTSGTGVQKVTSSSVAAIAITAPFSGIVVNSAGKFYGLASDTVAAEVNVTRVKDVV